MVTEPAPMSRTAAISYAVGLPIALLALVFAPIGRLEEFDYPAAAAVATTMLAFAFAMLLLTNAVQAWHLRYVGRDE